MQLWGNACWLLTTCPRQTICQARCCVAWAGPGELSELRRKKSHAETATDAVRLVPVCTPSHCRKVPTSRTRYRNSSWRRFRICCEIVRSQFLECGRALPFVPGGYRFDTSGSVCILHQGRQGLRECCCIRTVSCLKLGSPSCSKMHVACKRTDENVLA